ncbi:MAG: flagellar protein export ATPase FliI [Candidatus Sericytochromatia bacterium]|nr:flagellar protein export ATPase FliI [Candidatus Tanganyikabacteria bacterium]
MTSPIVDFPAYEKKLEALDPVRFEGRIAQVVGLVIESHGPPAKMGEVCRIVPDGEPPILAEVVGFRADRLLLMPLGPMGGIKPGSRVIGTGRPFQVPVGLELQSRILDGLGNPIDGRGPLGTRFRVPIDRAPPNPLHRRRIDRPIPMGVRCIDSLLTVGIGQRLGIFAGSGVGKSTLLGMIARNARADINVIGLIGERGREVREFIEKDLGPEGLARSVVVVATSDTPALVRLKGAFVATAIAESFRDMGASVMLMMDSVTRFAMAQREVGLATGEPPATKGYTPSVFALLPRLLERAGMGPEGSITGLYTVLVDADDFNEPISDAVRGILDGHIILSRDLAAMNHYPAIDVLNSISRVAPEITAEDHQSRAGRLREVMATYRDARDLINIGAYAHGSNPAIDRAITLKEPIDRFLRQKFTEASSYDEALAGLAYLVDQ